MTSPEITVVTCADDLTAISALIAHAFDRLDANHYLIPDPGQRRTAMTGYFGILAGHAAAGAGRVLATADGHAAAVWFDRTTESPEPEDYTERVERIAGAHADRFAELDNAFATHHPQEPHWHLALLAVHPKHQNTGLGGALLRHTHDWLDQNGIPAYLEASSPDSRRVYRRHYYTDMSPPHIHIGRPAADPGSTGVTGATFHRMWRTPRPVVPPN